MFTVKNLVGISGQRGKNEGKIIVEKGYQYNFLRKRQNEDWLHLAKRDCCWILRLQHKTKDTSSKIPQKDRFNINIEANKDNVGKDEEIQQN